MIQTALDENDGKSISRLGLTELKFLFVSSLRDGVAVSLLTLCRAWAAIRIPDRCIFSRRRAAVPSLLEPARPHRLKDHPVNFTSTFFRHCLATTGVAGVSMGAGGHTYDTPCFVLTSRLLCAGGIRSKFRRRTFCRSTYIHSFLK